MNWLDRLLRLLGLRRPGERPDPELLALAECEIDAMLEEPETPADELLTFRLALLGPDGEELPVKHGYAPKIVRRLPGPGESFAWHKITATAYGCRVTFRGHELFQFQFVGPCFTHGGELTIVWPGKPWPANRT